VTIGVTLFSEPD